MFSKRVYGKSRLRLLLYACLIVVGLAVGLFASVISQSSTEGFPVSGQDCPTEEGLVVVWARPMESEYGWPARCLHRSYTKWWAEKYLPNGETVSHPPTDVLRRAVYKEDPSFGPVVPESWKTDVWGLVGNIVFWGVLLPGSCGLALFALFLRQKE